MPMIPGEPNGNTAWLDVDNPVSGGTFIVPATQLGTPVTISINNTSSLALFTIQLPVTGTLDGQIVNFSSKAAILGLTITCETGGTMQGAYPSLIAGGGGVFKFRAAKKIWLKLTP